MLAVDCQLPGVRLVARLEKYRDEFALARQGLLPPEEYQVAEEMEAAVAAAVAIVRAYEPAGSPQPSGPRTTGDAFDPMMNV
ncbi:MAG: hypothetical protein P8010_27215 [Desulfosarcinaceae bacterium]